MQKKSLDELDSLLLTGLTDLNDESLGLVDGQAESELAQKQIAAGRDGDEAITERKISVE